VLVPEVVAEVTYVSQRLAVPWFGSKIVDKHDPLKGLEHEVRVNLRLTEREHVLTRERILLSSKFFFFFSLLLHSAVPYVKHTLNSETHDIFLKT
jgi:hypothetical protein